MTTIPAGLKWHFRAITILSIGIVLGDLILSAKFGATISFEVMVIAAMISLASGLLLVIACYFWMSNYKLIGGALVGVWVPCFIFNVISNMGVATANRMEEVQKASVQKAQWTEVVKGREEAESKLKFFVQRRDQLHTEFNDMVRVKVGSWQTTIVPPSTAALDKLVTEKTAERDREAGRGGCHAKCEARTGELNHLIALRGLADKIEGIQKQIAATEVGLSNARTEVAKTDAGLSVTANQSTLYAKWLTWASNPDVTSIQNANEGMGIGMAFVLAIAATGLTIGGAWPTLIQVAHDSKNAGAHDDASASHVAAATSVQTVAPAPLYAAPPQSLPAPNPTIIVKESDNSELFRLLGQLKGAAA